jgi:hypothetical protein
MDGMASVRTVKEMTMYSNRILLAAAALAVSSAANAAPWDHRFDNHSGPTARPEFHRAIVARIRVFDTLRLRHYRGIGDPYFIRGHYVVRTINPFGHTVFVEVDPYSGAFIGELRV